MPVYVNNILNEVDRLPDFKIYGQVAAVVGMLVEVSGVEGVFSIGDHCEIHGRAKHRIACEVIGFRDDRALLMPFGPLEGVSLGCRVEVGSSQPVIYPCEGWLGRVVNAFGDPVDGKGPLPGGDVSYPIQASPPPAHLRKRVGGKLDLGVRAMNTFLTCCQGQRMGIFSGSGVGKSTLMSMMARNTDAEVSIIGLIGERGREAREFIEDDLGEDGMARSVVIVATSNEPPLVRRQAAYTTLATAEFFRDQNKEVLCLMDSVTRFAMAQREISLSVGEPPASKGYTPSVFAELPRLLERAGPGQDGQGSITGLFTVLVEGDDHNEPVADAVRGILDGHVVLDREIAERGRFPAINILKSVSRTMPGCNTDEQNALVSRARRLISTYDDMAELIRLGAYRRGTDPLVDEAIFYHEPLEQFLTQNKGDFTDLDGCYVLLAQLLNMPAPGQTAATAPAPVAGQVAGQAPAKPGVQVLGRPPGQTMGQLGQPGPQNAAQPGLAQGLMPDMPRVSLPTDKQ
ncbi:flagellar protein export ATPase FliI [Magnetovibrio blakemorei]|uniref:flagellar protein export ATPase FliI n=1 Tax=Magnetovibrio blakemorei TaxID=28181 RepID=UPI0009FD23AB|nr:flagellar protein export ATPase FliI [Magnetovibrio blakemorei]